MIHAGRVIGFALLLTVSSLPAVAEEFTDAIHAYLQQAVEVEKLYAFLSACELTRDPGTQSQYSNLGMGLLGHAITRKAGTDYEALVGRTHDLGLAWSVRPGLQGTTIISHAGGTGGHRAFIGFDKARRRGVVILSNSVDAIGNLGNVLLESEWPSDRRPAKTTIGSRPLDSYVGQYRLKPDAGTRRFKLWPFSGREKGTTSQSTVGIRCEGDRLFALAIGSSSWPLDVLLPPVTAELVPESETRFFERLSGARLTFSRRAQGKGTRPRPDVSGRPLPSKRFSHEPDVPSTVCA